MTRAPSVPFRFFDLSVARTERVSPSVVRITFHGPALAEFTSGGRDQRIKLFLPQPDQESPVVPVESGMDWFTVWRDMDPATRAVMRSYTVRDQRREPDELDIDFAVHEDGGPASRWAARSRPGDQVVVLGPIEEDNPGVDFRPPADTDWVLLAADETALPAVERILSWLPGDARALVWIEVPGAADIRDLPSAADVKVNWLPRDGNGLLDAVRAADFRYGTPYAWIAGEAGTVRALRRHLVGERGFDRHSVTFTGYWRRGVAEDDLLAELPSGEDER